MKAIKRILAPTDFSDRATRALKYAVSLAQATEAKLFVLHAYQVPGVSTGIPYPMAGMYMDTLDINNQVMQEVDQAFEEVKLTHLKDRKIAYELISTCAFPEDAIEETIREKDIDLVVMGNRGDSALEKLLGSTTSHMMRRTTCPILAIPENAIYSKINRILFATDYRRVELTETFQPLVELATMFQAQIDVLHITPVHEKLSQEKLAVGEALDRILRHARHSYQHLESDDVLEGLRTYLREHEAVGMVAMMPRDHHLWDRLTHGSVTKEIIFESDRPVLVFRGNH